MKLDGSKEAQAKCIFLKMSSIILGNSYYSDALECNQFILKERVRTHDRRLMFACEYEMALLAGNLFLNIIALLSVQQTSHQMATVMSWIHM